MQILGPELNIKLTRSYNVVYIIVQMMMLLTQKNRLLFALTVVLNFSQITKLIIHVMYHQMQAIVDMEKFKQNFHEHVHESQHYLM